MTGDDKHDEDAEPLADPRSTAPESTPESAHESTPESDLETTPESVPGRKRSGAGRIVAPLVLAAAAVMLVVALVTAISTLRTPVPQSATLAPAAAATTAGEPTSSGSPAAGTSPSASATSTTPTRTRGTGGPTSMSPGATSGTKTGVTTTSATGAAAELNRIAAQDQNRPQGQVSAVLFDLVEDADDAHLRTQSGSSRWRADDVLWLYRQRTAAWPGAVLQAHTEGGRNAWRLSVSNPKWRTAAQAQSWCDETFAQYKGAERTARCFVPQG